MCNIGGKPVICATRMSKPLPDTPLGGHEPG